MDHPKTVETSTPTVVAPLNFAGSFTLGEVTSTR